MRTNSAHLGESILLTVRGSWQLYKTRPLLSPLSQCGVRQGREWNKLNILTVHGCKPARTCKRLCFMEYSSGHTGKLLCARECREYIMWNLFQSWKSVSRLPLKKRKVCLKCFLSQPVRCWGKQPRNFNFILERNRFTRLFGWVSMVYILWKRQFDAVLCLSSSRLETGLRVTLWKYFQRERCSNGWDSLFRRLSFFLMHVWPIWKHELKCGSP